MIHVIYYTNGICLSVSQAEGERAHKVRMGVGNGLRPDVWRDFHARFGEVRMCELYGSTEGNLCFMNHIGKLGVVGRSNFFYKVRIRDTCPGGVAQ